MIALKMEIWFPRQEWFPPSRVSSVINYVGQRTDLLKHVSEAHDMPEVLLKSNDLLITELRNRMDYHRMKKDKYKYMAYRKAIQSITECDEIIMSGKQAQKLPNVGKSIADKVSVSYTIFRLMKY